MRLALAGVGLVALGACAGCASEYHPEYHPQSAYSVNQTIQYGTTIMQVGGAPPLIGMSAPAEAQPAEAAEEAPPSIDPSQVAVYESQQLGRPAEVIGVVDVAVAGDHDASLALLRRRAAAMGADAIVGVEFHATHVSGLAVRTRR